MPDDLEKPITAGTLKKWFGIAAAIAVPLVSTLSWWGSVRAGIDAKLESNQQAISLVSHALEIAQATNQHTLEIAQATNDRKFELMQKDIADRRSMMDARYQQFDTRMATAETNITNVAQHQTDTDKTIAGMNSKLDWMVTTLQKLVDAKGKQP